MYQIAPVMVSSYGPRPPIFALSMTDPFGARRVLAGARLGVTNSEWYARAKAATARFDELLSRTAQIANKTERENILAWVGLPGVSGTPAYRRASVAGDLYYDVERFSPINVDAYSISRRTDRIEDLEKINMEFRTKVSTAETAYGRLPAPVVIERERIVPVPGAPQPESKILGIPTTYALVGGAALATALLVTALGGKG